MVASFLRSNLAGDLDHVNSFRWLKTCSSVGLADLSTICIAYIVTKVLPVKEELLTALPKQQAMELCMALSAALVASVSQLAASKYAAEHAVSQSAQPTGRKCKGCKYPMFRQPNGKVAMYCLNCGYDMYPKLG
jgi:hypothetical protein